MGEEIPLVPVLCTGTVKTRHMDQNLISVHTAVRITLSLLKNPSYIIIMYNVRFPPTLLLTLLYHTAPPRPLLPLKPVKPTLSDLFKKLLMWLHRSEYHILRKALFVLFCIPKLPGLASVDLSDRGERVYLPLPSR